MHLGVHHRFRAAAQHHTSRRSPSRAAARQFILRFHVQAAPAQLRKHVHKVESTWLHLLVWSFCTAVLSSQLVCLRRQSSTAAWPTRLACLAGHLQPAAIGKLSRQNQSMQAARLECMSLQQFHVPQLCCLIQAHTSADLAALCGVSPGLARQCSVSCAVLLRPLAYVRPMGGAQPGQLLCAGSREPRGREPARRGVSPGTDAAGAHHTPGGIGTGQVSTAYQDSTSLCFKVQQALSWRFAFSSHLQGCTAVSDVHMNC